MPLGTITIKSTKKANFGEPVEVKNYWFDKTCEPLAVIYGCFSPFTGKYGHARLLEEAKKNGINKFVIVSPNKKETIDNDRNMFTPLQKLEIAKEGCLELGYDILDAHLGKYPFFLGNLNDVAEQFPKCRIVVVCGPDRAEQYGADTIPFSKRRKEELPSDERGKYEIIVCKDRGEYNVSGTKVRELIRNNKRKEFRKLTGYSDEMFDMCRKYATLNGVIQESFYEKYMNEAMEATKRVGIKHLYNPGNVQELPPLDFIDLVKLIDEDKGILINGKNISITEKSDGAAFRFGLDDNEEFFIEQAYSGPIFSGDTFLQRSIEKNGGVNRIARAWSNLYNVLKNDEKTQDALKTIYEEKGAFKISGEVFLSALGYEDKDGFVTFVGSRYDKKKLGTFATIILFDNGPETQLLKQASGKEIKYDDAELENFEIKLNVKPALTEIKKNLKDLENEFGDFATILNNPSRKREDLAVKKNLKGLIENQQGILNNAIDSQLKDYKGKWGPDYEGLVFKFKDGSLVKITSTRFKEFKAKHDDTMNTWLKEIE